MTFTKRISVTTCFNKAVINCSEMLQATPRIYVKYWNKLESILSSIIVFEFSGHQSESSGKRLQKV